MKLLIQKRGEMLSTSIPGLILEATLLLPGACSCSCECSSSSTCGMTAPNPQPQVEKA